MTTRDSLFIVVYFGGYVPRLFLSRRLRLHVNADEFTSLERDFIVAFRSAKVRLVNALLRSKRRQCWAVAMEYLQYIADASRCGVKLWSTTTISGFWHCWDPEIFPPPTLARALLSNLQRIPLPPILLRDLGKPKR